jgi:hypothetical protein
MDDAAVSLQAVLSQPQLVKMDDLVEDRKKCLSAKLDDVWYANQQMQF